MSPDTAKQSLLWAWVHRSQNHPEGGLEIVFHPSHPRDSKLKSVQSIRKSPYHPSQNRSETAGLMHGVVLDWLQTMALKTRFWFQCKNDSRGPVWLRNSPPPPLPCPVTQHSCTLMLPTPPLLPSQPIVIFCLLPLKGDFILF